MAVLGVAALTLELGVVTEGAVDTAAGVFTTGIVSTDPSSSVLSNSLLLALE